MIERVKKATTKLRTVTREYGWKTWVPSYESWKGERWAVLTILYCTLLLVLDPSNSWALGILVVTSLAGLYFKSLEKDASREGQRLVEEAITYLGEYKDALVGYRLVVNLPEAERRARARAREVN